jgi:hypothetical protein
MSATGPATGALPGQSWGLGTAPRVTTYALCVLCVVVAVLAETWKGTSNKIGGAALLVFALLAFSATRRVRLTIDSTTLRVRNVIRRYDIPLGDVKRVTPSRYGVDIVYRDAGRSRRVRATVAQGAANPALFRRTYNRSVAEAITGRLSAHH